MGRAIHTNLNAKFKLDSLKLAVIKVIHKHFNLITIDNALFLIEQIPCI